MAFLPETPRQKKILLVLIAVLVWLAFDIYVGTRYHAERDTNFRAFRWDTHTLWSLKPSYEGITFGQSVHTNSSGFRGGEDYPLRSSRRHRIVCLGDSRTYGFGVGDHDTFSWVMQQELRSMGRDVEVINAGVHGFSAVQCRARLEQMLVYKPTVAVVAPGYNDRRYLLVRSEDNDASFPWIARARMVVDLVSWSNIVFAAFYEIGQYKLAQLKQNPPSLDQVPVRVSPESFQRELERMVDICATNRIVLVFLLIYQDPNAYAIVEKAARFYREQNYWEAIETIEESASIIPDRAYSFGRYIVGLSYRQLGKEEKAHENLINHVPFGSLFGEGILRSEEVYFDIFRETANRHGIIAVDGREAIVGSIEDPRLADERFGQLFIDECHYLPEGHHRMGHALASALASPLSSP